MLQRGDSVPHFEVKTVEGQRFSYSTIWQRRHLVLLAIGAGDLRLRRPMSLNSWLGSQISRRRTLNVS
jgi:hypothetical protein